MKWVSTISSAPDVLAVLPRLADDLHQQLGGDPDLVLAFVSANFNAIYPQILDRLAEHLPCKVRLGCSANGVIGQGQEMEQGPAISLIAARLPGVELFSFHRDLERLPDADDSPQVWRDWLGVPVELGPDFLIIADPFSGDLETFLAGLDFAYPDSRKIGGLASGAGEPRRNALYCGNRVYDHGVIGVALSGNVTMDTIIAQGCRPIGKVGTITAGEGNMITRIEGMSAVDYIDHISASLDSYDKKLMKNALFLGLAVEQFDGKPAGDFLIRNLVGVDYNTGSLVVAAPVEQGQLVQFHVRDREASHLDLATMLDAYNGGAPAVSDAGLLLFSCLGRGQYLYRSQHHDSAMIQEKLGPLPMGGFFCNGEIGPVGAGTYIHGYTSAIGVIRPERSSGI